MTERAKAETLLAVTGTWIAAPLTKKVIDVARGFGVDCGPLLDSLGDAEILDADTHYRIWETIMQEVSAQSFPIRYAERMSIDDYDALGLACKTAADLRGALTRVARYLALWTDTVRIEARPTAAGLRIDFQREGARTAGMRGAVEATVAEVVAAAREITKARISPARVYFQHGPPPDATDYAAFFGSVPRYRAAFDGFELEESVLATPLSLADAGLSAFVLRELDQRRLPEEPTMSRQVQAVLMRMLPEGVPKMSAIAAELRCSQRSVQRQLKAEGTSFSELLEQSRKELAERCLRSTQPSIAEIAFLLGFSEASAFHRAFKRWTGETPAAYRQAQNVGLGPKVSD